MENDNAGDNDKFVALIDKYKVILDRSQNPAVKEAKRVSTEDLIVEWGAISGKTLTQKSILKKLSNLKLRCKAADGKQQPLCNVKLLDITKDTNDDELLPVSTGSAVINTVNLDITKPETSNSFGNDIVDGYETSETKKLSNNQLKRIILLEQFKIVKLKRMKTERSSTVVNASNNIEIEYIGFSEATNGGKAPTSL